MDRRQVLGALAAAGTLVAAGGVAMADDKTKDPVKDPGQAPKPGRLHEVAALPFDPKKLKGISEKMIVSHHDNNYAGAVKNLNLVEAQLAQTGKDTPGFLVGGLRERELTFANSKVLHELYFANLGGDGKASGTAEKAIATAFGSFGRWEELFRATAMALGGGSGWVVLDWSFHLGELRIAWSGGHTQALAAGAPLLVLDLYEHAYQMDYGAATAKYVDAFMQNVQWDEVQKRWERAQKAHAAMRG